MFLLKSKKLIDIFFVIFVIGYAFLFLINPQLGPNDDFVFLKTLQSGKPLLYYSSDFPYYDTRALGRLTPMVSLEYNIFGLFSKSPSPFWYYLFHSIEFILFMILFIVLVKQTIQSKLLIYGAPILLSLLPAFTFSWFRLQLPERNLILLFTLLLLLYLAYEKNKKTHYLVLSFFIANLAIYYKEIVFAVIFIFALFHLIFSIKNKDRKIIVFDLLLMLSSVIYLVIYYFYVYKYAVLFLFRKHNLIYSSLIVYLKNIFNYAFFSDPILVLLLLPLLICRIYKIFIKKERAEPLFDSAVFASSTYIIAYFVLRLYNPYYLLPAYAFAIPPLIHFYNIGYFKNIFTKIAFFIVGLLIIFNSLPAGIHFLTYHKYTAVNFNKTLNFLTQAISSKNNKVNIFLDGQDLAGGRGTYYIFSEFLQSKRLTQEQYDLKSNVFTENPLEKSQIAKFVPSFSVFEKDTADEIKTGDYLIIIPQTQKNTDKDYIQSLKRDYDLIFQTKSKFAFPNINLKTLVKYFLSQKLTAEQKSNGYMVSENFLDIPDYYVFIKK